MMTTNKSEMPMEYNLTLNEELELVDRVRQGDKEAEGELMKVNIRLVSGVAKRYLNKGVSEEELLRVGKEGLIKAAHRFDASCGFKFMSYAVWWVRRSILAVVGEEQK